MIGLFVVCINIYQYIKTHSQILKKYMSSISKSHTASWAPPTITMLHKNPIIIMCTISAIASQPDMGRSG